MAGGLDTGLSALLGQRQAQLLEKAFGFHVAGDLLSHYPRRYIRRGEMSRLDALPLGIDVTVVAEVVRSKSIPFRGRRGSRQEVLISDGDGTLSLVFFNQPWLAESGGARALRPGARGMFTGQVTEHLGSRQLVHPGYGLFDGDEFDAPPDPDNDPKGFAEWIERPVALYPATAHLPSWKIRPMVHRVLQGVGGLPDPMPLEACRVHRLMGFEPALRRIHEPEHDGDWVQAKRTLRFHEAFLLQMALLQRRQLRGIVGAAPRVPAPRGLLERFDAQLPFTLTDDQRTVGAEIAADLAGETPMHRLLQGEVGSGKTLVALRAMLAVAESGGQSALLAPTEVLAAQHLRSIARVLGPTLAAELMPTLVTGQLPAADRRRATLRVVSGQARIVVGTHALLSDSTDFYDLGLVVVDEQHRFGVEQRELLRRKGTAPHTLVMTATPIPRTVAMTVFGDLETSVIRTLPAGRQPITTHVVPPEKPGWLPNVWRRAHDEVSAGRQCYVICPAIGAEGGDEATEGDLGGEAEPSVPLATVQRTLADLRDDPHLPGARVEALTGRMSSDEKDAVMRAFAAGEIDVLVATTVVEVGVDVPNATFMAVLDAERFGVSQLHQLRGRVGRGEHAGVCLLITNAEQGTPGRERVDAVAATTDGFELAESDLELRREGDVLGATQSGARSTLKLLRVTRDGDIIEAARGSASALLTEDPALDGHPDLRAAIERQGDEETRAFLDKN